MTVEERISAADRRKMDGNALFKEDKLAEAIQQYEMVTPTLCGCLLVTSFIGSQTYHFSVSGNSIYGR